MSKAGHRRSSSAPYIGGGDVTGALINGVAGAAVEGVMGTAGTLLSKGKEGVVRSGAEFNIILNRSVLMSAPR